MLLHLLTLSLIALFLTITHAYTPYPTIPTSGTIFGQPPYLTVSYYYPISPTFSHTQAYSTGIWPPSLPIRPSSIYECMPLHGAKLQPRTYTCKNSELAEDQKTPEGIRAYEEARARAFDGVKECDANTGLAMTTLHWGAWQHNCWSEEAAMKEHGISTSSDAPTWSNTTTSLNQPQSLSSVAQQHIQWNSLALLHRRTILLQLASHNYALNTKIRSLWLTKNRDLSQFQTLRESWKMSDKKRYREMQKREQRFWQESFAIREVGRELEKWVPIYFERRMKGESGREFAWLGLGDVEVQA